MSILGLVVEIAEWHLGARRGGTTLKRSACDRHRRCFAFRGGSHPIETDRSLSSSNSVIILFFFFSSPAVVSTARRRGLRPCPKRRLSGVKCEYRQPRAVISFGFTRCTACHGGRPQRTSRPTGQRRHRKSQEVEENQEATGLIVRDQSQKRSHFFFLGVVQA